MKRFAATLLSVLFFFGIFAVNVGAEDIPDAYRPVIEQYIHDLQTKYDEKSQGDFGGGLHVFDGNLDHFGYTVLDINSDGTPELIFESDDEYGPSYLAAVYTIENGQAKKLIIHGGSDNTMSLLGDASSIGHPDWSNCIYNLGDWDKDGPLFFIYRLDGTNLNKIGETRDYIFSDVGQRIPFTPFSQYTKKAVEIAEGPAGTIYRLYNSSTGEHLYTPDHNEATVQANNGWTYENIGWTAPTSGDAVYRLYNPIINDHLYTTDGNEVNILTTQQGWQADNNGQPLFYSGGDKDIYRLYNPQSGRHHLTTDENEYNTLPGSGWEQEGSKLKCMG